MIDKAASAQFYHRNKNIDHGTGLVSIKVIFSKCLARCLDCLEFDD